MPHTNVVEPVLEYAASALRIRIASGLLDVCYLALAVGCYLLVGYAQGIMPGGYSWGYEWEYANFLMTIAALASTVIFCVGLTRVLFMGHRRCPVVVLVSVWMSGMLPVLMLFFAKRWLQMNFA